MARFPKVRLRAIPVFPSSVIGATGVAITKTGNIWTIQLDVSGIHISGVAEADTATTYALALGGITDDNPKGSYSLVPFSGFQANSADLTSLSALGTFGLVARIGDADYVTRTLTAGTGIGVTNGNGIAGNPTVAISDVELLALAGVTSAADRLFYFTGLGTGSLATFTAFGRSLVDDADAATARTTLGLTSPATTTPAALTKTDDTNVTLTLGGTPATALLQATSLTMGWTGTLAASRGGTGLSSLGTGVATALAINVGSAGAFVTINGAAGTPSSITLTNASGTAASLTAGNVTTNANLTGDVTSVGNATTLTNAPVIAKVLTGYVSGAGTISATDSILSAIQKLNGNNATNANLTGDVTSVGNATTLAAGNAGNLNSGTLLAARMPAHTGDVTSSAGSVATTLANIPTGVPAAGTILHTNIAAPSSPAAGKVSVYSDSTDLRFHDKNASGVIGTTVVADAGASNNFLTAISAAGVVSKAQPSVSNLSGFGTNVAAALGSTLNAASGLVGFSGALGTPSSGTLTSCTGLPAAGVTGLGSYATLSAGQLANSLVADVALNNTGLFFTGPTVAQGTSGTWFASGTVTLLDTVGSAAFIVKLWDGTTLISSSTISTNAANDIKPASLSGVITSPAGNIRISVQDLSSTNGQIKANAAGGTKDSTLTVFRIG